MTAGVGFDMRARLIPSVVCLALVSLLPARPCVGSEPGVDDPDITWWSTHRAGANCQNSSVAPAYWQAVADAGIEWVRLVPDGWATQHRDFLIGDADAYEALAADDLETLKRVLDDAHAANVGVVLTMFSLPGARWRQLNGDVDDYRLWNEQASRDQALAFWIQLAGVLRDHPAIVAYNPLNEPHPEREHGITEAGFDDWYPSIQGGLADVDRFNREVVQAIRQADRTTPILLDGGFYASPFGLTRMRPVDDEAVLYALHYYEPWEYVTFRVNDGRFAYPDTMPPKWSAATRRESLAAVAAWVGRNSIGHDRIVLSEFGCDRRVDGAAAWLDHLLTDVQHWNWHWAFYAFRGDGSWGGLDYELGPEPFTGAYWAAVEQGVDPEQLKKRGPNALWAVIAGRL